MSVELKIRVRKETIMSLKAKCRNNSNCPIAIEVRDIFPNAQVGSREIFHNVPCDENPGLQEKILLPESAQAFICAFDNTPIEQRDIISPIEFCIEIPDYLIDAINIEALRPLLVNHPSLELI